MARHLRCKGELDAEWFEHTVRQLQGSNSFSSRLCHSSAMFVVKFGTPCQDGSLLCM